MLCSNNTDPARARFEQCAGQLACLYCGQAAARAAACRWTFQALLPPFISCPCSHVF